MTSNDLTIPRSISLLGEALSESFRMFTRFAGRPRAIAASAGEVPAGRNGYTIGIAIEPGKGPEGKPTVRPAIRIFDRALRDGPTFRALIRKVDPGADIRFVGRVRATGGPSQPPYHQRYHNPLCVGGSISHQMNGAGTIGAFAKWKPGKGPAEDVLALSCAHVLVYRNAKTATDPVIQPGKSDVGGKPFKPVGDLAGFATIAPTAVNVLDGAVARITDRIPKLFSRLSANRTLNPAFRPVAEVMASGIGYPRVYKVGRTTGERVGRISLVGTDPLEVGYANQPFTTALFLPYFEIEGLSHNRPFAEQGDSGSLVVDQSGRPVGMVFAVSQYGSSLNNRSIAYAVPIDAAVGGLNVELRA